MNDDSFHACPFLTPFLTSLFGGIAIDASLSITMTRLVLFFGFYGVFICLLYFDLKRITALIVAIVTSTIIFLIKLLLWFLRKSFELTLEVSDEIEDEIRPRDIDDNVWENRESLLRATPQTIAQYVESGMDHTQINSLLTYLAHNPDHGQRNARHVSNTVIMICNRLVKLPWSRASIDKIFPADHSIFLTFIALFMAFCMTYLASTDAKLFPPTWCWVIGYHCAIALYSILSTPATEPYATQIPDAWFGITRCFMLTIFLALYRILVHASGKTTPTPFGFDIMWDFVIEYAHPILFWFTVLFPLLIILGIISHPLTTIVWFFEAINRYVFGQSGVVSPYHMVVQFLRGAVTVVAVYFVIPYSLQGAIALSTFIAFCPLYSPHHVESHRTRQLLQALLMTAISCVSFLPGIHYSHIKIVMVVIFSIIDLVIPYLQSHSFWLLTQTKVLRNHDAIAVPLRFFRFFCVAITVPAFIDGGPGWLQAIVATMAVYRAHSEPIIWSLTTWTMLFLVTDVEVNISVSAIFVLAHVIATKLAFLINLTFTFQHCRTFVTELPDSYLFQFLLCAYKIIPLPDWISKLPSYLWSCITGSSMSALTGNGLFIYPSSPKPFYFWDFPSQTEPDFSQAFVANLNEHPLETPLYTSVTRALARNLSNIIESNSIGAVQAGDMFIFTSESSAAFVLHIISRETNCIQYQLRGLESHDVTFCHRGEMAFLSHIFDSPTMSASLHTVAKYQPKAQSLIMPMTAVTSTDLATSFQGISREERYTFFLFSFLYLATKQPDKFAHYNCPQHSSEFAPSQHFISVMQRFAELAGVNLSAGVFAVWTQLARQFFIPEAYVTNFDSLAAMFQGEIQHVDMPLIDLAQDAIGLGIVACFLASAHLGSDLNDIDDTYNFIDGIKNDNVYGCLGDDVVCQALALERQAVFTVVKIGEVNKLLRFKNAPSKWSVAKLQEQWVQMLWSNEARFYMFYQVSNPERKSIQEDPLSLNNLIVQSCDCPIGYPAYVSAIIESPRDMSSFKTYFEL